MFPQMIKNARNRWLAFSDCTVRDLIAYIENSGQMRDAQIDAIKTYLFLKIVCDSKPLSPFFKKDTLIRLIYNPWSFPLVPGYT